MKWDKFSYGFGVFLVFFVGQLFAEAPQWWIDRGVINSDTNAIANDFATANQGQAKHLVTSAKLEFDEKFGSASPTIMTLVSGFTQSHNNTALNVGQLKTVVAPFYNQLSLYSLTNAWPQGMTVGPYPWSSSTNTINDGSLANIGQLKYVFSFKMNDLGPDADSDQIIDVADLDDDNDGVNDSVEIKYGHDPFVEDSYPSSWPFADDFEARTLGSIDGQGGWHVVSGNASVQTNLIYEGSQALYRASASSMHHLTQTPPDRQVWVDMHVRPAGSTVPSVLVGEVRMYVDASGALQVQNGTDGVWSALPGVTLDTAAWQRLTILLDYDTQEWLVWTNGALASDAICFAESVDLFNALPLPLGEGYIDDISAGGETPNGIAAFGGEIIYTGGQTGSVKVLLTTNENDWACASASYLEELSSPGFYAFPALDGQTYYLKAFIDTDGNGSWTELTSEALGSSPAAITNTIGMNFDITVTDPDDDGDGVPNYCDAFPQDPAGGVDSDDDGKPDVLIGVSTNVPPLVEDLDDDNDGVSDAVEILYMCDPLVLNDYSSDWPFVEAFELRTVGDIDEQGSWFVPFALSEDPVVQSSVVHSGSLGLQVSMISSVACLIQAPPDRQVWVDMYIRNEPSVWSWSLSKDAYMSIDYDGALSVWDGTNGVSELPGVVFESNTWHRLTLFLDYDDQEWLVWTNGSLASDTLKFSEPVEQFNLIPLPSGVSYIDDITVGATIPDGVEVFGGEIMYTGGQTGSVKVLLTTNENEWACTNASYWASIDTPGVYTFSPLDGGTYYLKAFVDSDGNGEWTSEEAFGSNSVAITQLVGMDFDITLTDPDRDGDGMPDWWEGGNGLDPDVNDAAGDDDNDSLLNLAEYEAGTDPQDSDSDNDLMSDGWEVVNSLDPEVDDAANDADSDGLTNLEEYQAGSNPQLADSDDDGITDLIEVKYSRNPAIADAYPDTWPLAEGFETLPLGSIAGQGGWSPFGVATVQSSVVHSNAQALYITDADGLHHLSEAPFARQVWVEQYVQPAGSSAPVSPLGEARFYVNASGKIMVQDGISTGWTELPGITLSFSQWARFTLLLDYGTQEWVLWLDGLRVSDRLGFAESVDQFNALPLPMGEAYVDDIRVGTDVPGNIDLSGGEIIYTGRQTGAVKVLLTTNENEWACANASYLDELSEPGFYAFPPLDGSPYYLKAFMDTDGDGVWTSSEGEARGSHAVAVTRTIGMNLDITLVDPDTDADGIPDWWELYHFGALTLADAAVDVDFDGLTNLQEYQEDFDPTNSDSDGDSVLDGNELSIAARDPNSSDITSPVITLTAPPQKIVIIP